jgi:hypothetical protein
MVWRPEMRAQVYLSQPGIIQKKVPYRPKIQKLVLEYLFRVIYE